MTVERIELAPGYTISRLLKGGWHLAGGHGEVDRIQAIEDMAAFVEAGITSFDCADHYTGVEEMIGAFRTSYPELAGKLQVQTKFVPDLDILPTIDRAYIERIIDRSRARLGQDCLDLVQFFWWDWPVPGAVETALVLQDLVRQGRINHLGITNFSVKQMREFDAAGVEFAAAQLQYSLLDRRAERQMADYCRAHGMQILTYGQLAGGFFSENWLGRTEPVPPFSNRSLIKYKLIIDDAGGWDRFQSLLATLKRIGDQYGVGLGEVAVRWVLTRPLVAGSIVGATSTRHLARNAKLFDFTLSDADLAEIEAELAQMPIPEGDCYELENDRTGRHGSIMRYNQNGL